MSHGDASEFNKGVYQRVLDVTGCGGAEELATKLRVGRTTVFEWQRGERIVPQKHLQRLAKEHNKPIEWFYQVTPSESEIVLAEGSDQAEVLSKQHVFNAAIKMLETMLETATVEEQHLITDVITTIYERQKRRA